MLPVESGLFSLRPVASRAPRWFAALRTYLCHLPSLFHLGAVHGVCPCRVCLTASRTPSGLPCPSFCCQARLSSGLTLPSPPPFTPDADLPRRSSPRPCGRLGLRLVGTQAIAASLRCRRSVAVASAKARKMSLPRRPHKSRDAGGPCPFGRFRLFARTLARRASLVLRAGSGFRLAPSPRSRAAPVQATVSCSSRGIAAPLLSRPSRSDSRVGARDECVVGNGCHTASSTRTSHGVPALQGFTPSTLHMTSLTFAWTRCLGLRRGAGFRRCSLLMLDSTFSVPACASSARFKSASQGLYRWASQLKTLGSCGLSSLGTSVSSQLSPS